MAEVVEAPSRPAGQNYVAGEWRPAASGDTYEKRNPMRPSEVVATVASSSEQDVADAVAAADAAFADWAALPLAKRASYLDAAAAALEARAEQVAQDMTAEMGKPLRESRGETARAAQILRYAASQAFMPVGEHFEQSASGATVSTRRRPLGVIGLITPWNFPIAIPVWKLAPALVYGNTVVLKLAYEAPLTGLHVAEAAYAGAFWSAGQKCTATRRIYVQDEVYDAFRDTFVARIDRGKVGDPTDPEVEVGPIVNEAQFDEIVGAIERGREQGGRVL